MYGTIDSGSIIVTGQRPVLSLYPEWPHRQCVGLAFRRSHVRICQCSKSCDLQPALNCAIRGAQGVLPCVGWGVRPVNWTYRL